MYLPPLQKSVGGCVGGCMGITKISFWVGADSG